MGRIKISYFSLRLTFNESTRIHIAEEKNHKNPKNIYDDNNSKYMENQEEE